MSRKLILGVPTAIVLPALLLSFADATAEKSAPCGLFNDYKEEIDWEPDMIHHAVDTHQEWEFLSNWFGVDGHEWWELDYASNKHAHGDAESCG